VDASSAHARRIAATDGAVDECGGPEAESFLELQTFV
jgi:hypothetical protein